MATTTIDDSADICTLLNTFDVEASTQAAVVDSLRRFTTEHACRLPGFIGASVHASLDGRHVVNYVQWASRDHLTAMLESAPAKAHLAEVGRRAAAVRPVLYRVVFVGAEPHVRS